MPTTSLSAFERAAYTLSTSEHGKILLIGLTQIFSLQRCRFAPPQEITPESRHLIADALGKFHASGEFRPVTVTLSTMFPATLPRFPDGQGSATEAAYRDGSVALARLLTSRGGKPEIHGPSDEVLRAAYRDGAANVLLLITTAAEKGRKSQTH